MSTHDRSGPPPLAVLVAGVLVTTTSAGMGLEQQKARPSSFRAAVHLNTVAVTVMGPDGLPVGDLTADDFELWLDGEPQDIAFVLAPSVAPLELAVLIDTSESILRQRTRSLRSDLKLFLRGLEAEDCVLVMPFADAVGPGYWNVDLPSFVDRLTFTGNTKLNDAILAALTALAPLTGGDTSSGSMVSTRCDGGALPSSGRRRRVVVLITDGHDQGSLATGGHVLLSVWRARVPFIVLAIGGAAAPTHPLAGEHVAQLEALVRAAGGRFIQQQPGTTPGRVFDQALRTLRSTYVLASELVEPSTNSVPEWHSIQVRTRRENLLLAAPEGVYLSAVRRDDAEVLAAEARESLDEGHALAALAIVRDSIDADAEFWQPYFVRALALIELGHFEDATIAARRVVYLRPASAESHAILAEVLLRAGRSTEAARSVINAAFLGSDPSIAAAALERDHDVVLDLEELAEIPRVWVAADAHVDLALQQQAARVARVLQARVIDDPDLALVARRVPYGQTSGIRVELSAAELKGSFEGKLTLAGFSTEARRRHGFGAPTASFELSVEEAESLIGADPPDFPASLAVAFDEMVQRLR